MTFSWTEKARGACSGCGITENETEELILRAEQERCYVLDEGTGHRFCHALHGFITLWADYTSDGECCIVENVYFHRIGIREDG